VTYIMAEIRFGLVEGPGKGREVRVAASQTFYRRGGKFVKLVNGYATLCASDAATIHGWLETPKDASGYTYGHPVLLLVMIKFL